MKIREVVGVDAEKLAADNLKQNAKKMQAQATAAQAKLKQKQAAQQMAQAQAQKPIT